MATSKNKLFRDLFGYLYFPNIVKAIENIERAGKSFSKEGVPVGNMKKQLGAMLGDPK